MPRPPVHSAKRKASGLTGQAEILNGHLCSLLQIVIEFCVAIVFPPLPSQKILAMFNEGRNEQLRALEEAIKTESNVENMLAVRQDVFEILKVSNACTYSRIKTSEMQSSFIVTVYKLTLYMHLAIKRPR